MGCATTSQWAGRGDHGRGGVDHRAPAPARRGQRLHGDVDLHHPGHRRRSRRRDHRGTRDGPAERQFAGLLLHTALRNAVDRLHAELGGPRRVSGGRGPRRRHRLEAQAGARRGAAPRPLTAPRLRTLRAAGARRIDGGPAPLHRRSRAQRLRDRVGGALRLGRGAAHSGRGRRPPLHVGGIAPIGVRRGPRGGAVDRPLQRRQLKDRVPVGVGSPRRSPGLQRRPLQRRGP